MVSAKELKVLLAASDAMSRVLRNVAIRENNEEMDELHRLSELALELGAETAFKPDDISE